MSIERMLLAAKKVVGPQGLDPSKKSSVITLSSSNTVMTVSSAASSGYGSALSVTGHSTGKWYFEATNITPGTDDGIGIANASFGYSSYYYIGYDAYSFGAYSGTYINDTSQGYCGGGFNTAGTIAGLAVDLDNGVVFVRNNGTWQQNPVSTANGIPISSISTPVYAGVSIYANSTGGQWSVNTGTSNFSYSPPTGYSAWG